jgi:hypothetical protein
MKSLSQWLIGRGIQCQRVVNLRERHGSIDVGVPFVKAVLYGPKKDSDNIAWIY